MLQQLQITTQKTRQELPEQHKHDCGDNRERAHRSARYQRGFVHGETPTHQENAQGKHEPHGRCQLRRQQRHDKDERDDDPKEGCAGFVGLVAEDGQYCPTDEGEQEQRKDERREVKGDTLEEDESRLPRPRHPDFLLA